MYKESEESLLLISFEDGGAESGEEGRSIVTRTTRARSKTSVTSHDESKQVLKDIMTKKVTGGRKSVRMGPVGKKKTQE